MKNTIVQERFYHEMQYQFGNGRTVGRLNDRLDDLKLNSAFASPEKKAEYDSKIDRTKINLGYVSKPTNPAGWIAYELGKFIG